MWPELWAVVLAGGILLVRLGAAMHEAGMLRAKNSASAILRNLADIGAATIAFWGVGAAIFFAAPRWGVVGVDARYVFRSPDGAGGAVLLALAGILLGTGIVGGAMAERARAMPVMAASVLLAAVLSPAAALWARSGWLAGLGFQDLAGASFIHVAGAMCAGVGAVLVGPRMGKYNRDGSTNGIPGHSVPLALTGTLLMLAGWVPYLGGFALLGGHGERAGLIGVNALLAGAAGGLAAMGVSHRRYGKADVHIAFSGLLAGLVAIAAGADAVANWGALVIGAGAGIVVPVAMVSIELSWKIDDPSSGLATRGIAGAWGILATGVLAPAAGVGAWLRQVGVQALGLVAISALAIALSAGLLGLLKLAAPLRSKEADEFDGLDLAEHDIGAYPDFQQTTIKSYHLREA